MAAKGSAYERTICRTLSLWFSGQKHDDLFWRSSQSGGRATTRAKKGKRTQGHAGDVAATCSEGEWLTSVITPEIKRGYNRSAFLADLLDRNVWPSDGATLRNFIDQAIAAAVRARTPYWMLIHKRDSREALVYVPLEFLVVINAQRGHTPNMLIRIPGYSLIVALRLTDFLKLAKPSAIKRLARKRGYK